MTSCKACMAARLSSEDDTKTKTSTRPDVEEAIMKRPATPPGPVRDAKTASDAAMDSLSATYRPRPPRLRLCGGTGFRKERAATAAEAARGAAYAAAAATTAQEALIQAQAAEAEALKARDCRFAVGRRRDLAMFIAALATASSHARDAAPARRVRQ